MHPSSPSQKRIDGSEGFASPHKTFPDLRRLIPMPFRADEHALKARKEALERALRDIRDAQRQYESLKRAEAEHAKELREVDRLLKSAAHKRVLPLLDNLRIAAPCAKDWNEMQGDEHVRFCGACEKNVYNLSSLTREQAEALLQEKEGKLCVTYFQRKDGTVLTADCPVGVRKRRVRNAAAGVVAGIGAGMAAAFGVARENATECVYPRVAGGIAPPAYTPGTVETPPPGTRQLMGDVSTPPKATGSATPVPPRPPVRLAGKPSFNAK